MQVKMKYVVEQHNLQIIKYITTTDSESIKVMKNIGSVIIVLHRLYVRWDIMNYKVLPRVFD